MAIDTPHFDLPFRLTSRGVPCQEQDTFEDVANCVEVIIRTPYGFRDDSPEFGLPNIVFQNQPVITQTVIDTVKEQEPRADILIEERPDFYDALLDKVTVEIH